VKGELDMFGKILLAYDGSEYAQKASEIAMKLAKIHDAELEVVHVRPQLIAAALYENPVFVDPAISLETEAFLKQRAEEIINKAADVIKDAGIKYTTQILTGDPADEICKEAEKQKTDLIVIGSRGLNPVSRFFLGSVSSKVVNHAPCSVTVVR
jgi:nucleotide-binding universal stress UspA family protein